LAASVISSCHAKKHSCRQPFETSNGDKKEDAHGF
jgi:hypothetical protein